VRRWMPHDLSEANRRECVLKTNLLLEELWADEGNEFANTMTGNESWFFLIMNRIPCLRAHEMKWFRERHKRSAVKSDVDHFLAELNWCALIICLEVRHLTSCISRLWSCIKFTEGPIGEGGKAESNQWGFTRIMPEFTQQKIISPKFSTWRWRDSRSQLIVRTESMRLLVFRICKTGHPRWSFWQCWSAHATLTFNFRSGHLWRPAAGLP
jgi:hypothetical protein